MIVVEKLLLLCMHAYTHAHMQYACRSNQYPPPPLPIRYRGLKTTSKDDTDIRFNALFENTEVYLLILTEFECLDGITSRQLE